MIQKNGKLNLVVKTYTEFKGAHWNFSDLPPEYLTWSS